MKHSCTTESWKCANTSTKLKGTTHIALSTGYHLDAFVNGLDLTEIFMHIGYHILKPAKIPAIRHALYASAL